MVGSLTFAVFLGVFISSTISIESALQNDTDISGIGDDNNTISPRTSNGPVRFLLRPTAINSANSFNTNRVSYNDGDRPPVRPISESTGLTCTRPGAFVPAPDGCNRCYCDRDGQLTARCSRAYCPPGFPSGPIRRNPQH